MLRNATKVIQKLYSPSSTKFLRNMSTNVDPLVTEQAVIIDEQEKAAKRPATEQLDNDNLKQRKIDEGFERIKRKNYALLMGYFGIKYFGMQRNMNTKTIEEELFTALLKGNLITNEAFDTMQTIKFQRAARTDKFVSAVGQIVNLKMPDNPSKEIINQYLPDDIRIFAIKRVTNKFNSKNMCDARTYSYTLPTFSFATEEHSYDNIKEYPQEKRIEDLSTVCGKPIYEYRITEDKLELLSNILKKFEGPHNFFNYTSKIKFLDPRARRYIISFTCSKPFIQNNVEFITLEVKGQSFIMHQIRKMVGTVIGVLRGSTDEGIFERSFQEPKLDIPRAPGLGLVLKTVHMDYYNRRYGTDGVHEPLKWEECEEEFNTFFKQYILKHIVETEIQENNMINWLANMPLHSFNERHPNEGEKEEEEEDGNEEQKDLKDE